MTNITELLERSRAFDINKHDYTINAHQLAFLGDHSLVVGDWQVPPLQLTDWAWGQMCQKLGSAHWNRSLPSQYVRSLSGEEFQVLMNSHLADAGNADRAYLIRGYGDRVRAWLSDKYAVISNTEILEWTQRVIQEEGGAFPGLKFVRPWIDPDTLYVKIAWKDTGPNGNYSIGTAIGNGETGNSALKVMPFIQRNSCTNSIVVDDSEGYKTIHVGSASAKRIQFKAALVEVFQASAALLDEMLEAENDLIPSFADVVRGLCKQRGWDDDIGYQIMIGSEGSQTKAGLVNGISYAAHSKFEGADSLAAELFAGAVLRTKTRDLERLEVGNTVSIDQREALLLQEMGY